MWAALALGQNYKWERGAIAVDVQAAYYWYQKAAEQDGRLKSVAEADLARVKKRIEGTKGNR